MEQVIDLESVRLSTLSGDPVTLDPAVVSEFARGLRGRLCLPADPDFDDVRKLFNAVCDTRPGLIVQCLGVSDVIKCVDLARTHDLLVSVKGSGHHVSGFASCAGGMMIDLSRMKSVHVDPQNRTARAEPGCTLFDLDTECQAFGLAVPSGVVSNTGIAGLSLGGGLGWLMRSCGLTVDNILEFEIVTPDGELRKVNSEQHPDLYWALRGGGGNFGIVTSFQYRLHPVKTVTAGFIQFPLERAREVMAFYREYVDRCPDRLVADGVFWVLPEAGGQAACAVALCYNGPPEEAAGAVQPLREFGVAPIWDDVRPRSYLELQSILDQGPLPGLRYHQKDMLLAEITDDVIDIITRSLREVPAVGGADKLFRFAGSIRFLAGAVGRVKPDATAFPHREKQFVFEITTTWDSPEDDAAYIAWTEKLYADLAPFTRHGHYINGHMGSGEDFAREIYSPECYERLVSTKTIYDPRNMFRNNYNIKPRM